MKEETEERLVARRIRRKTPGGFETGFNFPKGDPRSAESRNSRAIGLTGKEETENVALRECRVWAVE